MAENFKTLTHEKMDLKSKNLDLRQQVEEGIAT